MAGVGVRIAKGLIDCGGVCMLRGRSNCNKCPQAISVACRNKDMVKVLTAAKEHLAKWDNHQRVKRSREFTHEGFLVLFTSPQEIEEAKDLGFKGAAEMYAVSCNKRVCIDLRGGSSYNPKYKTKDKDFVNWAECKEVLFEGVSSTMGDPYWARTKEGNMVPIARRFKNLAHALGSEKDFRVYGKGDDIRLVLETAMRLKVPRYMSYDEITQIEQGVRFYKVDGEADYRIHKSPIGMAPEILKYHMENDSFSKIDCDNYPALIYMLGLSKRIHVTINAAEACTILGIARGFGLKNAEVLISGYKDTELNETVDFTFVKIDNKYYVYDGVQGHPGGINYDASRDAFLYNTQPEGYDNLIVYMSNRSGFVVKGKIPILQDIIRIATKLGVKASKAFDNELENGLTFYNNNEKYCYVDSVLQDKSLTIMPEYNFDTGHMHTSGDLPVTPATVVNTEATAAIPRKEERGEGVVIPKDMILVHRDEYFKLRELEKSVLEWISTGPKKRKNY